MVLEKTFCLQLTKMDPLYIVISTGNRFYRRMSNVPLAYVLCIQRLPSVSSVCLAYDQRMSNVLFIRWQTLKDFEHVKTKFSFCV